MRRRLLARRPSPAMIVAVVALVSSLTGGAVAATLVTGDDIARNAVTSQHIANGKVNGKDLKDNAVKTADVADGTLLAQDFQAGQLPAGGTGPQGQPGADGTDGTDGADGADGANGANGANGLDGEDGRSPLTPLQTGESITGGIIADYDTATAGSDWRAFVNFPVPAPDHFTAHVDGTGSEPCTGNTPNPTAPPDTLCVYVSSTDAAAGTATAAPMFDAAGKKGFYVSWDAVGTGDTYLYGVWAYTAP